MTLLVIVLAILSGVITTLFIMKNKNKVAIFMDNKMEMSMEDKAKQAAASMSQQDKEKFLREFGSSKQTRQIIKGVEFVVSSLVVQSVTVFGKKYRSFKDALENANISSNKVRYEMMEIDAELAVLRKEKHMPSQPYKVEKSVFFGDVHKYSETTIGIDTTTGANANKPARIAVKVEKDEDDEMGITEIYVAAEDIATAGSYTRFNMQIDDDVLKFEALVANNKDEYGEEIQVIETILSRLDKYNYLVSESLVIFEKGKFIFTSPTVKQIEEVKKKEIAVSENNEKVVNIFDYMHSSQE